MRELAKAIVEAIDRLDRRGRIERIGQAPFRDIDEHPEAIRHILVQRAFRSHRRRTHGLAGIQAIRVALDLEQGGAGGHEIADHGNHGQHTVRITPRLDQVVIIDTKDDSGLGCEVTPGSSCRGSEP